MSPTPITQSVRTRRRLSSPMMVALAALVATSGAIACGSDTATTSPTFTLAGTQTGTDTARVPTPTPTSAFRFAITVTEPIVGTDTTNAQPVPGVNITLTRLTGLNGETLNPPESHGSIVTDASGQAIKDQLPGGSYRVTATPPAGSTHTAMSFVFAAPEQAAVHFHILLP